MKALVIAPQPFFTPRGTPFSVYYRTLVTSQLGVQVDLLTYGEGQDVDLPGVRIIRIPHFAFLGPIRVGPSLAKLFLDVFITLWTVWLLLCRRYAYVHAHEEAVFICRMLKPVFRFKLIYDMHSSLPQQLTNFGFTRSRVLIGLFERLERSCLKHADAVITICPDLAEYVERQLADRSRHFLIENSIFEPVRLRQRTNGTPAPLPQMELPPGRTLVVYAGTFERYQGLELLLRAFADIRRWRPDAVLLLVGGTPDQVRRLRMLADQCGLNGHCMFTGRVPPDVARQYVQRADVLVSPRIDGTNTPLKIYQQLASGIPLVATRIHSHTQVLNDQVCHLVEPKPTSMAQGILTAMNNLDEAVKMADAARLLYQQKYSRRAYEAKLRQVLQRLGLCVASQAS